MTIPAPAVSVIIPAYNGAELIAQTLDSLIAQTMRDFEVIVVDDCSTDGTAAVVRAYGDPRLRVVRAPRNAGCVHARNQAFALARGRYIAGLDHDDLCLPERFEKQVAFLDGTPDVVLVGTGSLLYENGVTRPHPRPMGMGSDLIDWMMLTRNPLVWSSTMFRADAARRLDPFERPDRHYVEDFDLYHRLRAFGRIAEIAEPLTLYRIVADSMSHRGEARMLAGATRLLAEQHAKLLGVADTRETAMVVRHVMARHPVPDVAVLRRVFALVERLRAAFVAHHSLSHAACEAVDRDVSTLWWRMCRAAIRSGAIHPRYVSVPDCRTLPQGGGRDMIVSGMIGRMRALRRKRAGALPQAPDLRHAE
ncbi:glycosyltransferase family 2 protein [Stakelama sp. CBK3Z-3]|uniref:Glycosyltransferase family 2 protein n=1 Tax=Stakelama flava TaxID=2860338 RepID=A0ABS6XJC8_9SPHN|nr:glycosyltransferase family A protein [Stakelama flava]MBW4330324.1 glycosyltransferase family 2 protein [Stakelama flava]